MAARYAGKLTYDFPAVADDYVVFVQPHPVGGQPDTFSAWVYGDGSGQYLNLWIADAQDELWSVHLGSVGGAGWKQMSGKLAPGLGWPSGHVSGPDNGVVDYPVRFYAIVLDRPADNPSQGTVYIDEIHASAQGASVTVSPALTALSTLSESSQVVAATYGSGQVQDFETAQDVPVPAYLRCEVGPATNGSRPNPEA